MQCLCVGIAKLSRQRQVCVRCAQLRDALVQYQLSLSREYTRELRRRRTTCQAVSSPFSSGSAVRARTAIRRFGYLPSVILGRFPVVGPQRVRGASRENVYRTREKS